MPPPPKISLTKSKNQKTGLFGGVDTIKSGKSGGAGGGHPWVPTSPLSSLGSNSGRVHGIGAELEKIERKPRRMSYKESREVVGKLSGRLRGGAAGNREDEGEEYEIYITLANAFWVGRHPSCDLVLPSPEVSNFHLRIYAVRTPTDLSIVCVQDVSTNGFYHNGTLYSPSKSIEIGARSLSHRSVVLLPGATLRVVGCDTVWTYTHNLSTHLASTLPHLSSPLPTSVLPLFPSRDPSSSLHRGPWIIHNYALGTGTHGVVHLASHEKGGLQVACKTIARLNARGERDALKKEVRVMMGLRHPNVLGVLDMVEDDVEDDDEETPKGKRRRRSAKAEHEEQEGYHPRMHLFLELVTGGDLFSYVDKYRMLTEDEVKWIAFQLIEGLGYIHSKDVAHRDIKPENILLYTGEAYPRIVIADFGMAITYAELLSTVPEHRHQVAARSFPNCGTTSYLPPERLRAIIRRPTGSKGMGESLKGTGEARRREIARRWFEEEAQLDIYGMGLTLYICATGQHPYALEQDPDAEGEEEDAPMDREATVTPASYAETEAYHQERNSKKSWDMFRAATAAKEEQGPQGEVQRECRKYLELALAFLKLDSGMWTQENWKYYSQPAKDFVYRLLRPTPSERPTFNKMLSYAWWKEDLEYVRLLQQTIVIQGRTRIPWFANAPSSCPLKPSSRTTYSTTHGKGKGKQAENLFLSMSTQHSEVSRTYDPIETVNTVPSDVRRNGNGRAGGVAEEEVESIRDYSMKSVSTPSTNTALESERSRAAPDLDDLMRFGSTPCTFGDGRHRGTSGTIMQRRPPRAFEGSRRESLLDRIHEDSEDDDVDVDGDGDVEMADREEEGMSIDED